MPPLLILFFLCESVLYVTQGCNGIHSLLKI